MKSLWASLAEILSAAACAKCSESHGHLTPGSPSMNPAASASHLAAIAKLQTSDKCWTASLIAYCDTQLISILFCLEFLIVTWVWDFGLLSGTSAQPEWAPEQLTVVQHETHEITGKLHEVTLHYIILYCTKFTILIMLPCIANCCRFTPWNPCICRARPYHAMPSLRTLGDLCFIDHFDSCRDFFIICLHDDSIVGHLPKWHGSRQ